MKAIMLMFDTLNRHMLSSYGCDWTHTPNFKRLAKKSVVFDQCYSGSLPCIPARRELHTGRYNFLHRGWGPIEPFDDSMPEILKYNGVKSHLVSDHLHYWEDGGATYHTRYNTWEIIRGQSGDLWKSSAEDLQVGDTLNGNRGMFKQDWINRQYMQTEEEMPQTKTFESGFEFIRTHADGDNWFLHIETFDPHEPFYALQQFKDMYPHEYNGPHFDSPPYSKIKPKFGDEHEEHIRYEYAALLSMCDFYLGKLLDLMDDLNLWKDTMLIVNTDHGFLLGEHGWWGKCAMPYYNEIAHIPLFIWDPRSGIKGARRSSLVQTIDLPATVLDYFNMPLPVHMQGKPLYKVMTHDEPVREAALFGMHGGQVNCTDGRYVYMRSPVDQANQPLYEYTLMPTKHGYSRAFIEPDRLTKAELAEPFAFTKEHPLLKIPGKAFWPQEWPSSKLYDLHHDPSQASPITDEQAEQTMIDHMVRLMRENDSPPEQYDRLGLADESRPV